MPVRDIVVTLVICGILPFVFRHAWVGVMLWTWLSIMNPHRLTWGFAYNMPFAAVAAAATLIALFTSRDRVRLPREGAVYLLIAFIVWMGVTTLLAESPSASLVQLEKVLKIQVMVLVSMAVLHTEQHLRWFVWVNALSLGFFGLKGGLYTIQTGGGGRVWGPGGFIGGNNEIGLAMLLVIPLLYFLYHESKRRWVRWLLMVTMLMSAVAILGTQSRGAFLAIVAMGVLLWWRSPVNRLASGLFFIVVAMALMGFMPKAWHDRMATITTYESDGSAMGRINAWETAINIANSRPTGAGFEMYTRPIFNRYAPQPDNERAADPTIPRAAHSIYFQVLGEHGWPGLVLFVGLGVMTWRIAADVRRRARAVPEQAWIANLAGMIQVSQLGFAVGGAFLSLAYFDLPYNLLIMALLLKQLVRAPAPSVTTPATGSQPRRGIAPRPHRQEGAAR